MHNSYDSIFNFQFSTFNLIETQQLHIVYFQRCNWYVSTLIFNFQFSISKTYVRVPTSDSSDDKQLIL